MLPGDRLVCAFVEPQVIDTRFKAWLLHVTIVPWFRLGVPSEVIANSLGRAVSSILPFEAKTNGVVMFGPHKDRPARLLQQPTPFTSLEAKVRAYLHKRRAFLVDETTKRKREFRPHVTTQADARLDTGNVFRCDRLYIVEQMGGYKEIVGVFSLGVHE